MIECAVILVAGMGTRLDPLTRTLPKCLVPVNNRPILTNTLTHLANRGIKDVVMLVGYMDKTIESRIGSRFRGMNIRYVKNPIFHKTNNMYSLWLARVFCPESKGVIIIEGDLFFEVDLLDRLISDPAPCCWAADEFSRFRDGCMLTTDPAGLVQHIEIIRCPLPAYHTCQHKSAGMLKLDHRTVPALWDCLEFEVRYWHLGLYYDQVIARHLGEFDMKICNIRGRCLKDHGVDLAVVYPDIGLTAFDPGVEPAAVSHIRGEKLGVHDVQ